MSVMGQLGTILEYIFEELIWRSHWYNRADFGELHVSPFDNFIDARCLLNRGSNLLHLATLRPLTDDTYDVV